MCAAKRSIGFMAGVQAGRRAAGRVPASPGRGSAREQFPAGANFSSLPARPLTPLALLWGRPPNTFELLVRSRSRFRPPSALGPRDLRGPFSGNELIPVPAATITRGIGINADPDAVWPWLSQLMRGGGLYGWPRLDTPAYPAANYLIDRVRRPRAGDRLGPLLEVAHVCPGNVILWRSLGPIETAGARLSRLTIEYLLEPAAPGNSRLWVHLRASGPGHDEARRAAQVIDFALLAPQLQRLATIIPGYPERLAGGQINRGVVSRHQALTLTPARIAVSGRR